MIEKAAQRIIESIKNEWVLQGHHLTGGFEDKLSYETEESGNKVMLHILDNTKRVHGKILNRGVPAEKILFSPGSGRKESEYIKGLIKYAKLRMGATDEEALSIAFAIAYTHKAEGMPSKGSQRFSKTGKRIEFVDDATVDMSEIEDILRSELFKVLEKKIWERQ